jgi:hypothetical protein
MTETLIHFEESALVTLTLALQRLRWPIKVLLVSSTGAALTDSMLRPCDKFTPPAEFTSCVIEQF